MINFKDLKIIFIVLNKILFSNNTFTETILGLITVAVLWGATNPFMKKGAQKIESVTTSSAVKQFCRDVHFLLTNISVSNKIILYLPGTIFSLLNIIYISVHDSFYDKSIRLLAVRFYTAEGKFISYSCSC